MHNQTTSEQMARKSISTFEFRTQSIVDPWKVDLCLKFPDKAAQILIYTQGCELQYYNNDVNIVCTDKTHLHIFNMTLVERLTFKAMQDFFAPDGRLKIIKKTH